MLTMKVVIVCESLFGNTELVAQTVSGGMGALGAEVRVVGVEAAGPEAIADCDLLVVGAPTHALTLSRPESRADAVAQGADPQRAGTGVREWLAELHEVLPVDGVRPEVAVFDTRILKAKRLPGSAAKRAARELRKKGFVVVDRTSFYVDGITGPLSSGQLQRALSWGTALLAKATARSRPSSGAA